MPAHPNVRSPRLSNRSISRGSSNSRVGQSGGSSAKLELAERDYAFIRKLVYERTRIDLGSEKRQLVIARLGRRIREIHCPSFQSYCQILRDESEGREIDHLIGAISTNNTFFFREPNHFRFLVDQVLPEFASGRLGSHRFLNVWSCACSTGEEPYSIAMNLAEQSNDSRDWQWSIECSDVSNRALESASKAIYSRAQVHAVEGKRIRRFLEKGSGKNEGLYRIRSDLRERLRFRNINLFQKSFPWDRKFQLIFCRNAMIYFDRKSQQQLVNRLSDHLSPGGYLMIGHAESLTGIAHPYKMLRPGVYRLPQNVQ